MFVAVYRWKLKPGHEASFQAGWERITLLAREQCGSGGSALFRDKEGTWVGIARWPDRAAREACFSKGPLDAEASAAMKNAVAEVLPDMELDAVSNLWADLPPA
jgi:heme-degrading monooxygenase HmoA